MSNIKKAVGLTAAFISLPKSEYLLSIMLFVGLFFGASSSALFGALSIDRIMGGALEGLFLLSIPAILTSVLIKLMLRAMPFRRIIAASLLGQAVYAVSYFIFLALTSAQFTFFNKEAVIFFAASLAFLIWFMAARLVFILRWRAFLFAALQTVLYGAFLITGKLIDVSGDPTAIVVKFFAASAVFLGFIYFFFLLINAPMKRSFGLNTLDAVSLFLSHWFYESKGMEEQFERVGEEAETLLSAYLFKRKNDTLAFVIPYVHFGPFGTLGGSDFSHLLAKELSQKHNINSFVFHGTVTHDLNPVASTELSKIVSSFEEGMKGCAFAPGKVSFSRGFYSSAFSEALVFGDSAFVGISRAPETTEDINFGLGLAMMSEGEKLVPSVSVIDQHNAETGDITSFEPGSSIGFDYMNAVSSSLSKHKKPSALSVGYSMRQPENPRLGLAGIKVSAFSTSPQYIIVLLDCNGVSPRMRERIISCAKESAPEAEIGVYTTDTHIVNRVSGVLNSIDEDKEILATVRECVSEAVSGMQPAKFASFKRRFKIHVLGARQSIEIISTVNAIVAVAKIAAPLIIIGSIISVLWVISRI